MMPCVNNCRRGTAGAQAAPQTMSAPCITDTRSDERRKSGPMMNLTGGGLSACSVPSSLSTEGSERYGHAAHRTRKGRERHVREGF